MKEFFADFLELLSNCVLVMCLAFSSFLLILNFYHYQDIRTPGIGDFTEVYNQYKKLLVDVDKKMESVNVEGNRFDTTAKPIYTYYKGCKESLESGTFAKLEGKTGITAKDVYDANNEILKTYNTKCIFNIPYNITVINKNSKPSVSFSDTFKKTEEKRKIVIDNADYLVKSGLGNSSYSFSTETSRNTIYDRTVNEYRLTINNYKMIASILNDVADWYVLEFGGAN